jgi:hypothetical protein
MARLPPRTGHRPISIDLHDELANWDTALDTFDPESNVRAGDDGGLHEGEKPLSVKRPRARPQRPQYEGDHDDHLAT